MTLDKIAHKYGTDKRTTHHAYTLIYEKYFEKFRNESIKILEIGVREARSLKMWEEYFTKAEIYGIDIGEVCKEYETDRIKIFIGDQSDKNFMLETIKSIGQVDIIIDDGSHKNVHQQLSFRYLLPYLKPDGLYIIEDLHSSYGAKYGYGGGFKKPGTTIEWIKDLIDAIHYPVHKKELHEYTHQLSSVHVYQDICFMTKSKAAYIGNDDILIKLIHKNKCKRIAQFGVGKGKIIGYVLDSLCKDIVTEYWGIDEWKDNIYLTCCKKLRWAKQLKLLRTSLLNSIKLFGDGYFDLVYVESGDVEKVKHLVRRKGILVVNVNDNLKVERV